jgi:hypothetical protein
MLARSSVGTDRTEDRMTTVLCHCRVADYDAWRRGYDHAVKLTPGVRSCRAWRAQSDPSLIMVEEAFDTWEQAQAAWTSAETTAAMEADGIDMSSVWVDYFDEVGSGEPAHE